MWLPVSLARQAPLLLSVGALAPAGLVQQRSPPPPPLGPPPPPPPPSLSPRPSVRRSPPQPPEPTPISLQLCLLDGNVLLCYSMLSSIGGLFSSGEWLEPPVVTAQDFVDISAAFGSASTLVVAWLIAASLCGACREDWFALEGNEHRQAPLGVSRLLASWAAAVPIVLVLRAAAAATSAASEPTMEPPSATGVAAAILSSHTTAFVVDNAGQALAVLVVLTIWRRWLLQRQGVL